MPDLFSPRKFRVLPRKITYTRLKKPFILPIALYFSSQKKRLLQYFAKFAPVSRKINIALVFVFWCFTLHASAGARHTFSTHSLIVKDKNIITVASAVVNPKTCVKVTEHIHKRKSKGTDTYTPGICPAANKIVVFVNPDLKFSVRELPVEYISTLHNKRGPPAFL